jgi:hypothetical protein
MEPDVRLHVFNDAAVAVPQGGEVRSAPICSRRALQARHAVNVGEDPWIAQLRREATP